MIRRVPAGDRLLADQPEQNRPGRGCPGASRRTIRGENSPIETTRTTSGYFLAEQSHRPERPGLGDRHRGPGNRVALKDQLVDGGLDLAQPLRADGLGVAEVEPQSVRLDLGPGLLGVLAEVDVQGMVQDVRRRVGAADRLAAGQNPPRTTPRH